MNEIDKLYAKIYWRKREEKLKKLENHDAHVRFFKKRKARYQSTVKWRLKYPEKWEAQWKKAEQKLKDKGGRKRCQKNRKEYNRKYYHEVRKQKRLLEKSKLLPHRQIINKLSGV